MSVDVRYLDVARVLQLHDLVIQQTGGDPTVLQQNLLESAVAQPAMTCFGQETHPGDPKRRPGGCIPVSSLQESSLCGRNKRTAYVVAEVFLRMNGYTLKETVDEMERMVLSVADGSFSKANVVDWFRERAARDVK
jgi:death on curing protein